MRKVTVSRGKEERRASSRGDREPKEAKDSKASSTKENKGLSKSGATAALATDVGRLFVQAVRGERLLPMDSNKSSDPFVVMKLYLDGEAGKLTKKWRSNIVYKSLDPVWNEGTMFEIPKEKDNTAPCLLLLVC